MLVSIPKASVTPDTAEALRSLERALGSIGAGPLRVEGTRLNAMAWDAVAADPGPTRNRPEQSMRGSGREVYLSCGYDQAGLDTLWAHAVASGFTPWDRYPTIDSPTSCVFHYYGHWLLVIDSLHAEGAGEWAWRSAACAAQLEAGTWGGGRIVERTIQAHLHRIGAPCGRIDGVLTDRQTRLIQASGLGGMPSAEVAARLEALPSYIPDRSKRTEGVLQLRGGRVALYQSGGVRTASTPTGYVIRAEGEGTLTVHFKGE